MHSFLLLPILILFHTFYFFIFTFVRIQHYFTRRITLQKRTSFAFSARLTAFLFPLTFRFRLGNISCAWLLYSLLNHLFILTVTCVFSICHLSAFTCTSRFGLPHSVASPNPFCLTFPLLPLRWSWCQKRIIRRF